MNNYFEKKLTYNHISFRYSKGKSLSNGNEIHPYHEILFFIDGDATFLSENFKEELKSNILLIIPKAHYHNFQIKDPTSYTRFVVNFPDMDILNNFFSNTLSEIKIIQNINKNTYHLLKRMCDVIQSEQKEQAEIFLYGAFLSLIAEIYFDEKNTSSPLQREREHLISKCLQYIDTHLADTIHIQDIAKEMNVSVSTLFHCFKKEMDISLHKYLIEKRMIYAHKLISEGKNPTKIYIECGYNDYSSFYKAYIKAFGCSPSDNKRKS